MELSMVEHANDDELAEAAAHETETEEVAETEVAEAEGMTEAADVDADDTEEVVEAEADDVDGDDAVEATGDYEPTVDPETWNKYLKITEALLFASAEPLTERVLANRLPEDADIKGLLKALRLIYADRGVNLVRSGASWAFRTSPELADYLNKEVEVARKLSRAAIETLAIVGYHQPVTRAEIEEIRGVSISKGTLDVLMEEEWIKPSGRRQTPGRPLQWGTTDSFLDHFGLETIRELPGIDELKAAGLLDASPAINAYRATADMFGVNEEDDETGDEEDALPKDALSEVNEEPAEPLDPDDGRG